ncbi:hypothetical protein EJ07DRAFT_181497 [Lizonia empirigonia]|nr:hypothetical protein EJ07DRAFT_181497 [Lizonia empirigonia]
MADAQIHLYPFNTADCTGSPVGSPLELKQGKCVDFNGAHSVKPMFRADHQDWMNEVNELRARCRLETFPVRGCPANNKTQTYLHNRSGDLPNDFGRCLVGQNGVEDSESSDDDEDILYSAKFVCEDSELLYTSTIEYTSWSMDPSGTPHSTVDTEVITGTVSATPSERVARSVAIDTVKPVLEPRDVEPGTETRGAWMLHPWSSSLACYLCYTKKGGDYGKIECRLGKDFPAQCGPKPGTEDGEPITSTSTTTTSTTATTTTHTTTTSVTVRSSSSSSAQVASAADLVFRSNSSSEDSSSDSEADLPKLSQKKSWHRPVRFLHPWMIEEIEMCADAEWEKRGRPESYIKIQHSHKCNEHDRSDSKWLSVPTTRLQTELSTTTTTSTIKHTLSRRHDQL